MTDEIIEYPNGSAKLASNGHWVRGPDITPIMRDPVGMQKRGQKIVRERAIASQLRGLARATKELPEDADFEEIAAGALTTIEALTKHFVEIFLQSNNIRGLGEAYSKLIIPLLGESREAPDRWKYIRHARSNPGTYCYPG